MSRKIMVVEDDQPILDLMDLMIRKLGYEPILIANGLEALELITKGATSPYPAGYHDDAHQRLGIFRKTPRGLWNAGDAGHSFYCITPG